MSKSSHRRVYLAPGERDQLVSDLTQTALYEVGLVKAGQLSESLRALESNQSAWTRAVEAAPWEDVLGTTIQGAIELPMDPKVSIVQRTEFIDGGRGRPENPVERLALVATDIVSTYEQGVNIACHTESRPLIPVFRAAKVPLPFDIQVDYQQMGYTFYWVELTFSTFFPADMFALNASLEVTLHDSLADPARRARPIRLFPDHKDVQLFRIDLAGAIGIDAGMNIFVPLVGPHLQPFGQVNADAHLKAGFILGPYQFSFRKAAIEVEGRSADTVHWRYNLQSELPGVNDFMSVLVLKVAKEAKTSA